MSVPAGPGRESGRPVPRTPLRVQLVVTLVLLVGLAVLATGAAATAALRGYLLDRADAQLVQTAQRELTGPGPRGRALRPRDRGERIRGPGELLLQVTAADGTVLLPFDDPVDGASPPRVPAGTADDVTSGGHRPFTVSGQDGDGRWRALVVPLTTGGTATLALDLREVEGTVDRLLAIELITGAAALVLAAVAGLVLVRRSLRPLVEVEHTAEAIAAGDLSRRVPAYDPRTEVGHLAGALNAMLGQLEQAFRAQASSERQARASEERMRRFVADASHELRTPLTSIRGFAELHRQGAVPSTEVPRVMRRIEDEAARMGLLVGDLLTLARLDQQRPLERAPVDLLRLATDAAHDARGLAPDRQVTVEVGGSEPPVVVGDEGRLRQVFANLVGNALTHTPAGTPVRVSVHSTAERAVIEVADEGPGLSEEQAARVFERFYRADTSRTRPTGGSGLGLSIVAALVAAHGGQASVDTAPGRGAVFRVTLPR